MAEQYIYKHNEAVLRNGGKYIQPVRGYWLPYGDTGHYNFYRDPQGDAFAYWDADYGWQSLRSEDVEIKSENEI